MAISFTIQHIPDLNKGKGHSLAIAQPFSSGTPGPVRRRRWASFVYNYPLSFLMFYQHYHRI